LDLTELDSYIEKWVTASEIPGASLALVENDGVIFAKGYGVRNLEKKNQ